MNKSHTPPLLSFKTANSEIEPYGCYLKDNAVVFNDGGYGFCSSDFQCICTSGFGNGAKSLISDNSTSYGKPSIYAVVKDSSGSEDAEIELSTAGGTRVILKGDNFGPAPKNSSSHLSPTYATYCNLLPNTTECLEDCSYVTSTCTVISHTMIECFSSRSKAGCKRKRLRWRVTVEDHSSDFSNAAINFKKANISDIVSPKKYSLNTEGGQAILLNGSDFGSLNETLISAIYKNDLTNVSYTASGCVVTKSDIQIRC